MANLIEGKLLAEGKKFALVASRFNDFITDRLVGGAVDALIRSGAKDEDIEIVKVPGAFEIPLMAKTGASRQLSIGKQAPRNGLPASMDTMNFIIQSSTIPTIPCLK